MFVRFCLFHYLFSINFGEKNNRISSSKKLSSEFQNVSKKFSASVRRFLNRGKLEFVANILSLVHFSPCQHCVGSAVSAPSNSLTPVVKTLIVDIPVFIVALTVYNISKYK